MVFDMDLDSLRKEVLHIVTRWAVYKHGAYRLPSSRAPSFPRDQARKFKESWRDPDGKCAKRDKGQGHEQADKS